MAPNIYQVVLHVKLSSRLFGEVKLDKRTKSFSNSDSLCAHVRERERDRERERECVCVCEREREREREKVCVCGKLFASSDQFSVRLSFLANTLVQK